MSTDYMQVRHWMDSRDNWSTSWFGHPGDTVESFQYWESLLVRDEFYSMELAALASQAHLADAAKYRRFRYILRDALGVESPTMSITRNFLPLRCQIGFDPSKDYAFRSSIGEVEEIPLTVSTAPVAAEESRRSRSRRVSPRNAMSFPLGGGADTMPFRSREPSRVRSPSFVRETTPRPPSVKSVVEVVSGPGPSPSRVLCDSTAEFTTQGGGEKKRAVLFDSRTHMWETDLMTGSRVLIRRPVRNVQRKNASRLDALAQRLKKYDGRSPMVRKSVSVHERLQARGGECGNLAHRHLASEPLSGRNSSPTCTGRAPSAEC